MTGLYPHNHRCVENNDILSDDIPVIAEMLDGYHTAHIGKWHLGNEILKQHGFDEWIATEEYRVSLTNKADVRRNCDYDGFLRDSGYLPDDETDEYTAFTRHFCTRILEEHSKPAFTAREAIRFIHDNAKRPFALFVNFLEPHPPYYSAFDGLYDPDSVHLPSCFGAELGEGVPLKYRYNQRFQLDTGRHFPMKDEATWRKLIARYWGAVSLVDKYLGIILDALSRDNLERDTIVVFTSDHGDMMGDFRMAQKSVMLESAVRVPLLVKIPGLTDSGCTISSSVSLVDLLPTLLDIMGRRIPDAVDGRSLLPVLRNPGETGLRDVFIEWHGDEGENKWFKTYGDGPDKDRIKAVYGAQVRTIVSREGVKLSVNEAGEREMYDLTVDPMERTNVFDDPASRVIREDLMRRLRSWQQDTGDDQGRWGYGGQDRI